MEPTRPTYTTDAGDIVDEALRKALNLDTDQPYSEPPDWSASTDDLPDSQLLTDWRAAGERVATDDDLPPELTLTLEQCAYCGTPTNAPNYAYHVCVSGGQSEPPELDFDDLADVASAWPWNVKDALRRFVGVALTNAGIADKAKHLAVQDQLAWLFGEET